MHSRAALVGLALASALTCTLVLFDMARERAPLEPENRLILPELGARPARIARIAWHRPEQPEVANIETFELARNARGGFSMPGVESAFLDQETASQTFAALATMRYVRRERGPAAAFGLDRPRLVVRVVLEDDRQVVLLFGQHVPGIDRVWLARMDVPASASTAFDAGSHAGEYPPWKLGPGSQLVYLIDGHVARSLDRRPRDLRTRRVIPAAWQDITGLTLDLPGRKLELSGPPVMLHIPFETWPEAISAREPGATAPPATAHMAVAPEGWRALTQSLRELTLNRFLAQTDPLPAHEATGLHLVVRTRADAGQKSMTYRLTDLGPCPLPAENAERLVTTTIGLGCIDAASLERVTRVRPADLLARSVFTERPIELTFHTPGDQPIVIRSVGGSWSWERDTPIEAAAVDAWLEHLEHASDGRYLWPSDLVHAGIGPDTLTVMVSIEARFTDAPPRRVDIVELPDHTRFARRHGEPAYLALARSPHAESVTPVGALRWYRRQVLALEPYSLREAVQERRSVITGRIARGEILDDWRVIIPEKRVLRAGIIDDLRELARLRAQAFEREAPRPSDQLDPPRARLRLYFDPSPLDEQLRVHELDIGRATASGCLARLDGMGPVFSVAPEVCEAAVTSWFE